MMLSAALLPGWPGSLSASLLWGRQGHLCSRVNSGGSCGDSRESYLFCRVWEGIELRGNKRNRATSLISFMSCFSFPSFPLLYSSHPHIQPHHSLQSGCTQSLLFPLTSAQGSPHPLCSGSFYSVFKVVCILTSFRKSSLTSPGRTVCLVFLI